MTNHSRIVRVVSIIVAGLTLCASAGRAEALEGAQVTAGSAAPSTGRAATGTGATGAAASPAAGAANAAAGRAAESEAAKTAPDAPKLRLPVGVRPTGYDVRMTLRPEQDEFSGTIEIALEIPAPTRVIWLNGTEISVKETLLKVDGKDRRGTAVTVGDDFIAFSFDDEIPAGKASMRIAYTGKASTKDSSGVFRQKEGEDWYMFTQFEATDARRAFPCFDEPPYKVPWQLTLEVAKGNVAVSNTPIESETEAGDGLKAVRFAKTKPLPSYLVAFGVGPLEFVDLGTAGEKKTPLRIVVTKGLKSQTAYAAKAIPELLVMAERYFGTPFPYEKLDFMAIPVFGGGMENAGLVTMSKRLLVIKPEDESVGRQRSFAVVTAHEIAHQWFGDLVTMAWWDDTWLNEAFASWMEYKMLEPWKPAWNFPLERVDERGSAMRRDSLASARRVRQPIATEDDIATAFDRITYSKGTSLLSMFEGWIGPEKFRKGVQRYLAAHAWGNATADDFLAAMSEEGGRDLATSFATFINEPGVPLVSVERICDPGAPPKLRLSQKRYLPLGSEGSADKVWQIPACVRYGGGSGSDGIKSAIRETCSLMTTQTADLPLPGAEGCPTWVLPNEGESGYYRWKLPPQEATRLFVEGGKVLTPEERLGVFDNLLALTGSGDFPAAEMLGLIPAVANDDERLLVQAAVTFVKGLDPHIVPKGVAPNYQRFIRKTFGARARALGFHRGAGEGEETLLIRPRIVGLVVEEGDDPALNAEAKKLAVRWLDKRSGVEPEMLDIVLAAAARHGDAALFERYWTAAKKTTDRSDRGRILDAMTRFRDPALVQKRLEIGMGEGLEPREASRLIMGSGGEPETREAVYTFVKKNYDAIIEKMSRRGAAYAPSVGSGFCDEAHRADVESFFKERAAKVPGGTPALTRVSEGIGLCIARRQAQQTSVAEFLKRY